MPNEPSTSRLLGIVAAVVAAALGLAGIIYALTRNDESSVTTDATVPELTLDTTLPDIVVPETASPVTDPAVTEPASTPPPDTAPPDTVPTETSEPPATVLTTTPDGSNDLISIPDLLAWTSFSEEPLDAAGKQSEVDTLIADRTVDAVAHPTKVSTICAGVPVNAAIDLTVTWQYLGETVQSDPRNAAPPGAGSCIDNGGDPLPAGSYQVFASTADESEVGYVTTFVIGANVVNQRFVNNTDQDICDIGVGPLDTQYYELFVSTDGAITPGDSIDIEVASVEQDLRATLCDGTDLDAFTFFPSSFGDQNLSL